MTTYNDNESHLGNLRILLEIQQRALGLGESAAGTTYVFENTPKKLLHLSPKSCGNFT